MPPAFDVKRPVVAGDDEFDESVFGGADDDGCVYIDFDVEFDGIDARAVP